MVVQAVIVVEVAGSGRTAPCPPLAGEGVASFVSGNPNAAWSNLPSTHLVMVWQLGASRGPSWGKPRLDMIPAHCRRKKGVLFPLRLVASPCNRPSSACNCCLTWQEAQGRGAKEKRALPVSAKTGGAVIERSGGPSPWWVWASRANSSPQKAGPDVEWTGVVVCCHPSSKWHPEFPHSVGRNRQSVIVVDMARSAGHVGVPVGQQEARRAVIEDRRGPRNGVMASPAQLATPKAGARRGVHWISRLLPKSSGGSPEFPQSRLHNLKVYSCPPMWQEAQGTFAMTIGQGEADRRCAMVEGCSIEGSPQPTVKGMARFRR